MDKMPAVKVLNDLADAITDPEFETDEGTAIQLRIIADRYEQLVEAMKEAEDGSFVVCYDESGAACGITGACPTCGGHKSYSHIHHKPNCKLNNVLTEARKPLA